MTRGKIPDRRPNETFNLTYTSYSGTARTLIVTVGFDRDAKPFEVFCASFKVGTDTNAIVSDACIMMSRLLQHGETPAEIARGMCQPHSLLGQIAAALVRYEPSREPGEPADPPRPPSFSPAGELVT